MNYPWLDRYCLSKTGAVKEYQTEWQATKYLVGGKMFALQGADKTNRQVITLKLEPAEGNFLRTRFADIRPGYYMNKDHWNSVYLDGRTPDDVLRDMVDKYHQIVLSSLSKKTQKEIRGEA